MSIFNEVIHLIVISYNLFTKRKIFIGNTYLKNQKKFQISETFS